MTTTNDDNNDWLTLQAKMSSILTLQKSQSTTLHQQITTSKSHLTTLANHHSSLLDQSTQIQSSLSTSINNETRALQNDNAELSTQLDAIQSLSRQKEELLVTNSQLVDSFHSSSVNIDKYRNEASSHLTNISELEFTHKRNIPKIQRELTLHAMMTNIKWDYTKCEADENVLRGEVSLVDRGVLREF
eukprot:CAMPEP_0201729438 /NCGR_PEP_ID=MMETSP0593-20130828/19119_1 /ASSEMBLY_ACC=CAM_ASM_000672 /TAXON_ID=267983 /ORGANISM="Skeletonema japonicum, Strain CCMP2506" /LENGTH=187 /DNA_ID=CAMNT_0048221787 /DNA_START=24 /DNA_END=584 /DNA_ORIENTATION=-